MIDMSSLMDEMDSMPSVDAPGKTKMSTEGLSAKATQSSTLKQREKEAAAGGGA